MIEDFYETPVELPIEFLGGPCDGTVMRFKPLDYLRVPVAKEPAWLNYETSPVTASLLDVLDVVVYARSHINDDTHRWVYVPT